MKNVTMKMAVNDVSERLELQEKKMKERNAAIMSLTREIVKAHPNLEESEGMDYIQKDIIQIGLQKKEDWP